jgi:hypothetical protein
LGMILMLISLIVDIVFNWNVVWKSFRNNGGFGR